MNDFKIDITDKYTSNTGNVEYTLYERKNGALYEMDSDLNLYNLIKRSPENTLLWFECYESTEAHDNGQELIRLYKGPSYPKNSRQRIYNIENYFINEDIE